jgi:ribulose-5-phosphate 4-epimerase/fuculose-1-phosphate aldolase
MGTSSKPNDMSETEWLLRVDLAACYRAAALYGWTDLIFTHISVRIPGPEHHFLINPYGLLFEEITASSLVKIDLTGNKVEDSVHPVNPAGFTIHSAIHAARDDAQCVIHTHTAAGCAVAAQKDGLLPLSQQSLFPIVGQVAYHDYEGVALHEDEKPRLVADLGGSNFYILRNHGLLTCGESVAHAFLNMYLLESACSVQLRAQSSGAELLPLPQKAIDNTVAEYKAMAENGGGAFDVAPLAWQAVKRKVDRQNPGYAL